MEEGQACTEGAKIPGRDFAVGSTPILSITKRKQKQKESLVRRSKSIKSRKKRKRQYKLRQKKQKKAATGNSPFARRQNAKALLRQQLMAEQGGLCFYCCCVMSWEEGVFGPRAPTIDHVVPRCDGGKLVRENAVMACRSCNIDKGVMSQDEYFVSRMLDGMAPWDELLGDR